MRFNVNSLQSTSSEIFNPSKCEAQIPLREFFDYKKDRALHYDTFKSKISNQTKVLSEFKETDPNQLIRFVSKGRVIWMTHEQAVRMLEEDENGLKNDIENTLNGDIVAIRQEMQVLLAHLRHSLEEYCEKKAIPSKEAGRLNPMIEQRDQELQAGIENSILTQNLLEEKKKTRPFLNEYEHLMAQFVSISDDRNSLLARHLAQQLQKHKNTYLKQLDALEKEMKQSYKSRLTLQKSKRNIIDTQIDVCQTRHSSLETESAASASGTTNETENLELVCLETATNLWKKEKHRVEAVIENIADEVLQEPDLKTSPLEQAKEKKESQNTATILNYSLDWMEDLDEKSKNKPKQGMYWKRK